MGLEHNFKLCKMRWKIASALMATAISQIDQSNGFTANPNMISHMDESGTQFAKAMLMSEFFPEPVKTKKKDDWLTTAIRKYPKGELTDLMRFVYERIVSNVLYLKIYVIGQIRTQSLSNSNFDFRLK